MNADCLAEEKGRGHHSLVWYYIWRRELKYVYYMGRAEEAGTVDRLEREEVSMRRSRKKGRHEEL
jgi:hypothetical protein